MSVKLVAKGKVIVHAEGAADIIEAGTEFEVPTQRDADRLIEAGDAAKPGSKDAKKD